MKCQNIKIFVCSHKPEENIPHNEVYIPIHLERAISPYKEQMAEYIGDDTGDNISERGLHYCEGTAMYWIWKNVHDCKYVGISQYRRQFMQKFTNDNIEKFFADGTDVILSKDSFVKMTRFHKLLMCLQAEDFLILRGVIRKLYPEYIPTFTSFLHDYVDNIGNMIICKKELYDKYAEWAFSVCFEMEKYIRYSNYTNSSRLFGYVLELLTPIYFLHNKCKIKKMDVLFDGKPYSLPLLLQTYKFFLHNIIWRRRRYNDFHIDLSFGRGLNACGINLDFLLH